MKILIENNIDCNVKTGSQKTKCPQCQTGSKPHNLSDNPLTVTIEGEKVVWYCHHCEWTGGTGERESKRTMKIFKAIENNLQSDDKKIMLDYFEQRYIPEGVVEEFKLFIKDNWIGFPYFLDEKIVNIKHRSLDKRFKQEKDAESILYNYKNVKDAKEIIFVEGEIDVLSLATIGINNVTTLPNGAPKSFKGDANNKRFSALEKTPINPSKLILFVDQDEAGQALHKELVHRFGKNICWSVKTPKDCKDANDVLVKHGFKKLQECIDDATPYPVEGLYTSKNYFHKIHDLYDGNYERPLTVGEPSLDKIYKIMPSTFHVWTGVPNHGKSMFLDFCLLRLAKNYNWKFAIFSPEHSTEMHLRRLVQMQTQKSFDEGFENRMSKDELTESLAFLHRHFHFIETKDAIPKIDLILDIAKNGINKFGIDAVVIDPYNEVDATRKGNTREDEHIRNFISKCKRFARNFNTTFFVVAHPTKLAKNSQGFYDAPSAYEISGSAHWYNQSDAIVTIQRDFETNVTTLITRKIREQGLYGSIGSADFIYDTYLRTFKSSDFVSIKNHQEF